MLPGEESPRYDRYPIEVRDEPGGGTFVTFPDFPDLEVWGADLGLAYREAEEKLVERLVRCVELDVRPPEPSACGTQVLELSTQSLRRVYRAIQRRMK